MTKAEKLRAERRAHRNEVRRARHARKKAARAEAERLAEQQADKPPRQAHAGMFQKGNTIGPRIKPGQVLNTTGAGPPRKVITPAQLLLIAKLKSQHISESTIARACGMSPPTFSALKQEHQEIRDALEWGHGLALDGLIRKLKKQGDKHFIPNIYLSKALHGLIEGGEQGDRTTVQIVVLPGAANQPIREGDVIPEVDDTDDIPGFVVVPDPPAVKPNGQTNPRPTQHREAESTPGPEAVSRQASGPSDYRWVGKAMHPLTMTERLHQQREMTAGRPDPFAPPPQAQPDPPLPTEQPPAVRRAVEQFEQEIGIKTIGCTRGDFSSEAAWQRFNRKR